MAQSLDIHATTTLFYNGKSHTIGGLRCGDYCKQFWCFCYPWVDFQADDVNERLQYYNDCLCVPCCCLNKVSGDR